MFIPVLDENPLQMIRFQIITAAIVAINVVAFLFTGAFGGDQVLGAVATGFGVIPTELLTNEATTEFNPIAEPLTLVTYAVLHAGWLHLIANMLLLWILGDNVEDAYGHLPFLIFYVLSGVAAGLTHVYMTAMSSTPLIGASGAVAGVMGAYLVLFPRARITVLLGYVFPFKTPAFVFLLGWFALQFFSLYQTHDPSGPAVAWWAHIGGFLFGVLVTLVLRAFPSRTARSI
jgi:membrane associated rhomboid family serine protease